MISRRWTWDVLCLDLGVDVLADCYWAMPFSVIVALGWAWMFWFYDTSCVASCCRLGLAFLLFRTHHKLLRAVSVSGRHQGAHVDITCTSTAMAGRWCLRPPSDTAHRLVGWMLDLIFVLFGKSV